MAKLLGGMLQATFGGWARYAAEEAADRRAFTAQQAVVAEIDEATEEGWVKCIVRWQSSELSSDCRPVGVAQAFDGWEDATKTRIRRQICNDLAMRHCGATILKWAFGEYALSLIHI